MALEDLNDFSSTHLPGARCPGPGPIASKLRSLHHNLHNLLSTGPRRNRSHRNLCNHELHSHSPRSRLCGSRLYGSLRSHRHDLRSLRSLHSRRTLRSVPLQTLRRG